MSLEDPIARYATQLIKYRILVPTGDGKDQTYCINGDFQTLLSSIECSDPVKSIRIAVNSWLDIESGDVSDFDCRQLALIVQQIFRILSFRGME
jgi:hypothetical protein